MGNTPQSYGTSPAIMAHTVLPATRHTASQASCYSIYLPRRDGRLSGPRWLVYISRWFTCPKLVAHPNT